MAKILDLTISHSDYSLIVSYASSWNFFLLIADIFLTIELKLITIQYLAIAKIFGRITPVIFGAYHTVYISGGECMAKAYNC